MKKWGYKTIVRFHNTKQGIQKIEFPEFEMVGEFEAPFSPTFLTKTGEGQFRFKEGVHETEIHIKGSHTFEVYGMEAYLSADQGVDAPCMKDGRTITIMQFVLELYKETLIHRGKTIH